MAQFSFTEMAAQIPTEASAYEYLEGLRWRDGVPVCPHCDNKGANFIRPRNGTARTTRTGSQSERRLWQCKACRKQFSAMTGTIFHGSKVPLRTWLFVLFEMCASKNGMAAREIERKYHVAPKTAWFMAHRLREAMKTRAPAKLLDGIVVADETWIGGEPKFRHANKRVGSKQGKTDKTPVLALIDADSGVVRSKVVANVQGATLRKVIAEQTAMGTTTLHTDMAGTYQTFSSELAGHQMVNHKAGEYVRKGVSTNLAEGYFSQLKRSIDGTHRHVSVEHLPRYLAEFDFRYSTCHNTDAGRLRLLMRGAEGRRLSYKRVTGGY